MEAKTEKENELFMIYGPHELFSPKVFSRKRKKQKHRGWGASFRANVFPVWAVHVSGWSANTCSFVQWRSKSDAHSRLYNTTPLWQLRLPGFKQPPHPSIYLSPLRMSSEALNRTRFSSTRTNCTPFPSLSSCSLLPLFIPPSLSKPPCSFLSSSPLACGCSPHLRYGIGRGRRRGLDGGPVGKMVGYLFFFPLWRIFFLLFLFWWAAAWLCDLVCKC